MLIILSGAVVFSPASASEEDMFNEDDLFSDPDTMIDSETLSDASVALEAEKPGISLSGSIYNTNWYLKRRDNYLLKSPYLDDDDYKIDFTANILLEGRYKAGTKAFGNFDLIYYSQGEKTDDYQDTKYTDALVRELFFDVNIYHAVYFRMGKQFLKWGRNYFWNPTDLINVERKSFVDLGRNLEGTKGIKIHIPFGTQYNIYSFIQLEDVDEFADIAWSGKFEFLVGDTEMALSMWYKDGYKPVYGYDFSTRVFRMDVQGEISLSYGENRDRIEVEENAYGIPVYTITRRENEWVPRASLSITKYFDLLNINDRLRITGEFFYNNAGYKNNVFNDPIFALVLLGNELYEPNYVSEYYAALFTSLQQFMISDITLNFNLIGNLTDGSGIMTAGISYNPWYDVYIELAASTYIGDGSDEYTFSGNDHLFRLELRYRY